MSVGLVTRLYVACALWGLVVGITTLEPRVWAERVLGHAQAAELGLGLGPGVIGLCLPLTIGLPAGPLSISLRVSEDGGSSPGEGCRSLSQQERHMGTFFPKCTDYLTRPGLGQHPVLYLSSFPSSRVLPHSTGCFLTPDFPASASSC